MLHLEFSSETLCCKVFAPDGCLLMEMPMHDAAVNGPGFEHWGRCPRGTFAVGTPVRMDSPAFGDWFTPVTVPGRPGIGIHGGGSDLPDPMAAEQGWEETHGCLRLQNADNAKWVQIRTEHTGACEITVSGP